MKTSRLITPLCAFLLLFCALLALPASAQTPSVLGDVTTQVAAGYDHTCALTTVSGLKCWGSNDNGQLGDGSTADSPTPVAVNGLATGVAAIATGDVHTCALTTAGGVKCWGANYSGRLGDGTTTNSPVPVAVSGLSSGVAAIAAGARHTCALTTTGGVECWGQNDLGQLGDGTTTERHTPAAVSGLASGVVAITAGGSHTCALTTTGAVKCWGSNLKGALGDGTSTDSSVPVAVSGLASGVAAITTGTYHSCALTTTGGVKCWGSNYNGRLGDGTAMDRHTPVAVSGLSSGVAAITAGTYHTCALTTADSVKCWGSNYNGQLGNGSTTNSPTPVAVSGLSSGAAAITAGGSHTCALTMAGKVACWGDNAYGQLGDGTTTERHTPVAVGGLSSGLASSVTSIAAGFQHTCALTTAGEVGCWGNSSKGQLGNGSTTDSSVPVAVSSLIIGVVAIAAGDSHTCALTAAGAVKCWGWNFNGQLGDGSTTDSPTPVAVSGLASGVVAIAAGANHTCAVTTADGIKCWGRNYYGQLGDGSSSERHTPVAVSGLTSGVSGITAGVDHTCALTTTGAMKCWGYNSNGELGDGTTTDSSTAVVVSGLSSGVAAIEAGYHHSCALTTAGAMKCWGRNYYGQLGDGTNTNSSTPVAVSGLTSGVAAIAAGGYHSCVLTTAGAVKCWGWNNYGQLGDGTTSEHHTPEPVSGLTSGMATIAAGGYHSCALTTAGAVKCWGWNNHGQLGDGSSTDRYAPVAVLGLDGIDLIFKNGFD